MSRVKRFCAYDDREVREIRTGDPEAQKVFGSMGKGNLPEGYYHADGRGCGRQFLTEEQTYTEGESDLNPPVGN